MEKEAKTLLVDAEEYYEMRHKLFMVASILVDHNKGDTTTVRAMEKILKVMRGDE